MASRLPAGAMRCATQGLRASPPLPPHYTTYLGHDLTTDGLPLGMVAVKFWNRKKFKGTAALKRKINPTRVPIEG